MEVPSAARSVEPLIEQSLSLENSGEIAAALQLARKAYDLAKQNDDRTGLAAAQIRRAYLEFRLGHYNQAKGTAEDCLKISSPQDSTRADAFLILGNVAAETSSFTEAEDRYLQAADLSRTIGYPYVRMRSQHNLAMGVYFPRGQFDQALAAAKEAYRLAEKYGYPGYFPYPLTTLVWIYQITGQTGLARETLGELAENIVPGSLHEGYFHFLAGQIALDDEIPKSAQSREHFLLARSTAEAIGEPGLNVLARMGISRSFQCEGDGASALDWAEDALEVARRAGYRHMQGLALVELGRAAHMERDCGSAEASLREAISILGPLDAGFDFTRALLELASLLLEQDPPTARSYWAQACQRILTHNYLFLADRETRQVYPLVAAFLNDREPPLRQANAELLERLTKIPPPPLRIFTLGKFEVTQGVRRIPTRDLSQRKAGELLGLLWFSPEHCLSAEQVVEALWPENDSPANQHLLHHATSSLRRALEPELPARLPSRYLHIEEGQVFLYLPPGSWIDFDEFEKLCQRGAWEAAFELYDGDFLPPYLYSNWTMLLRQRVAHWLQSALIYLAEKRLIAGSYAESLELCDRLLGIEPWHERAVEVGMRACLGMQDLSRALRLYHNLEQTLLRDLSVEPQQSLRDLAQEILRQRK